MVGYASKNRNIVDTKFLCVACELILRKAVQLTNCGHRLCHSCFEERCRTPFACPECLTVTQIDQMFFDKGIEKCLKALRIECMHCPLIVPLPKYQDHLDKLHPNPEEHSMFTHCVLKNFGCDEEISVCNLVEHYSSEKHQNALREAHNCSLFKEFCEHYDIPFNDAEEKHLNNALLQLQKRLPTVTFDFFQIKTSEPMVQDDSMLSSNSETLDRIGINRSDVPCMPYVWKIDNVEEKLKDARQTSIYSPPFYSSPTGYKMRARLCFQGDGNARRTHMSLFFVLMRGVNDPILKFPFNYKVTFCLYDQTGANRHIIDSFRPDIKSNSFQRPRSDMNIASGIPKFIPLSTIQGQGNPYVRDNTMFIKVFVDLDYISQSSLTYGLTLNAGIPSGMQLAMIKREEEAQNKKKQ